MDARRLAAILSQGGGIAQGGLKSLTVADTTPIDPQSSIGASGSGWVAIVVLKGLTSLVGTAVPSALTLSVSDPGYDTSGNATTVTRTITGVAHMRRQYPNGASKMISTDGTDLTLYITLDDWIYSGTTIVSASMGSSFYPGCTAGNAAAVTNLSATAYTKPIFGWINAQGIRAASSTYPVESVAFHRNATAGQQVACVKYSATDGTNTSATVTVGTPTTSALITQGNIPEVWAGSVDLSTLTAGQVVNVNAKVYPWLGDSTAVLDLSVSGTAWPTSLPQTLLRVYNDRNGAYGGGYAYVQVGASGGTVSATPATAAAAPFPTVVAALAALKIWNNANRSHNDVGGGIVRLMDASGSASTHTIAGASVNSPGLTYCDITKDPAAVGAVSVTWSAQSSFSNLTRWSNLILVAGAAQTYMLIGNNEARSMIVVDGCTFDLTAAASKGITWYSMKYLYNLTLTGGRTVLMTGLPDATSNIAIAAGLVSATNASVIDYLKDQPKLTIGCRMPFYNVNIDANATGDGDSGRIVYNNRFLTGVYVKTTAQTLAGGFANVQNVFESDNSSSVASMNMFSDADLTTITNYVEFHNTAVGGRASRMYNDVAASKVVPNGLVKIGTSRYNIWDDYNIKSDTFTSGAGSVGNFAYAYGVGNSGNVSLFGAVNRQATDAPHNDNADVPYLGSAWLPSSEYNLFRTALGFTQAQIMAMFGSYTVAPQGTPAVGGNYVPLSTATNLKGRVPSGKHVLAKDISGTARRTDGTGAAGAYESA